MMIIAFQVFLLGILFASFIELTFAEKEATKNRITTVLVVCIFGYIVSITI